MSVVDWHSVTGGKVSNFSLIEDLLEPVAVEAIASQSDGLIDPALEEAMAEVTSEIELPVQEVKTSEPVVTETIEPIAETAIVDAADIRRIDGVLPIEDYSADGDGLRHFKQALSASRSRLARIAVIGDSYIEGDILTQDIRRLLQAEYGGNGVGYMSMHSDFPGFRRSVNQSDDGWTVIDIRNHQSDRLKTLSGEYCKGDDGAVTTFKAAKFDNARHWNSSKLLFVASSAGRITISTDSCENDYEVEPGEHIQMLSVSGETSRLKIVSHSAGLKVLGAWLEDGNGVGVDCMSLRGNSGASHRMLSPEVAGESRGHISYDLIILEYGMNALSPEQTDYSSYGKLMSRVIARIKECYPDCDIMMLGVGDRGWKNGASVGSIPTVEAMIAAQRKCAASNGILFWDTRKAMGGEDAIVDWRDRGLVNADYIHLNHKGGGELAKEFVNSLKMKINE